MKFSSFLHSVCSLYPCSGSQRERASDPGGTTADGQRQGGVFCRHGSEKHGPRHQEQGAYRSGVIL